MLSSKLKYLCYGTLLVTSLSSLSVVHAGTEDGVFGDYFRNMINDNTNCSSIPNPVVTGFNSSAGSSYGTRQCTPFGSLIASFFGTSSGGNGQAVVGFTTTGVPMYNYINWINRGNNITYTGSNVGIGTISPGAKLEIAGSHNLIRLNNTSGTKFNYIEWNVGISRKYWAGLDGNGIFNIQGDSGGSILLAPNTGNVGIGITNPSAKLEVNGNMKVTNANITSILTAGTANITNTLTAGTGNITNNLTVGATVTANMFLYNSDKRLKDHITPLTDSLDKILSLTGYSYDWKSSGRKDIGVIAQEVETVFPELVKTNPDTGLKSVEYANLVAPLIESIKEQQTEIDMLRAEIKEIKSQIK